MSGPEAESASRLLLKGAAWAFPFGLLACSAGPPDMSDKKGASLSVKQPGRNAAEIAAFVKDLCIDAVSDPEEFQSELAASNWNAQQVQKADETTTLSVWDLDNGQLVHSEIPLESSDKRAWDCSVHLDAPVAPDGAQMAKALGHAIGRSEPKVQGANMSSYYWNWRPSMFQERTVTVDHAAEIPEEGEEEPDLAALTIHVSNIEFNPLRSLFGN